jgi:hypothetical protein
MFYSHGTIYVLRNVAELACCEAVFLLIRSVRKRDRTLLRLTEPSQLTTHFAASTRTCRR